MLSLLGFAALSFGPVAFAGTIHGTVTNMTNGKVSVGDKVSLLSLSAALEEVQTTKTDAQGHFTVTTPTEAPYLIKVEHENGSYFKNVPPGTTQVEITVYDVAAKVEGVSTEADVLRLEAENGQLKVTENYFVKNVSSPPRTQSSSTAARAAAAASVSAGFSARIMKPSGAGKLRFAIGRSRAMSALACFIVTPGLSRASAR